MLHMMGFHCLALFYIKEKYRIFQARLTMVSFRRKSRKHFKKDAKRAAIELSDIRSQLTMSESILREAILEVQQRTAECNYLQNPVSPMSTRMQGVIIHNRDTTK